MVENIAIIVYESYITCITFQLLTRDTCSHIWSNKFRISNASIHLTS